MVVSECVDTNCPIYIENIETMFKFIRKGPQPSFERQKLQRELFAHRKVSVSLNIESFFKYLIRNFEFSLSNVRLFFIEINESN